MKTTTMHASTTTRLARWIVAASAVTTLAVAAFAQSAPTPVAFVNVTAVPMDGNRVVPGTTVVVAGDRVTAMGPSSSVTPPAGATIVDGRGKFLMPGLAEMHGHIPSPSSPSALVENVLFLYVANGVTLVRGMQGAPGQIALRERSAANQIVAPTLLLAGPAFSGGNAATPEAASARVRQQQAEGWDLLKIQGGLSRAAYDALAATARELKMPFGGHVPAAVGVAHALLRSQDTIDHLDQFAESLGGASAPVDDAAIRDLAARVVKAGTWVVPTLYVWETLQGPVTLASRTSLAELKYLPPPQVAQWTRSLENRLNNPRFNAEGARHYIDSRMRIMRALDEAGARILLGSDAPQQFNVPGFSIHLEMRRMIDAGMTPYEVIKSGSADVAVHVGTPDAFGKVAVGHRADFILVDANPLADVANVRMRAGVMLRGRWMPETEIQQRLAAIAASYAGAP
jgi:imidazolonepropionase-like amidohydrolase